MTNNTNNLNRIQPTVRWMSYLSILLAVVGAGFYWWNPLGIVLSLAGLTLGMVDWIAARRRSLDARLAILGVVLCAIALAFDVTIACLGWQMITFQQ